MNIYLLKPIEDHTSLDDDPWSPWYDKAFGFVVRAANEEEARKLAQSEAGAEAYDDTYEKNRGVWLDPALSTCVRLTASGEPGVILHDVWHA